MASALSASLNGDLEVESPGTEPLLGIRGRSPLKCPLKLKALRPFLYKRGQKFSILMKNCPLVSGRLLHAAIRQS